MYFNLEETIEKRTARSPLEALKSKDSGPISKTIFYVLTGLAITIYYLVYLVLFRTAYLFFPGQNKLTFFRLLLAPFSSVPAFLSMVCLILLTVLLYWIFLKRIRFLNGETEEDRFNFTGSQTLGSARWMKKDELEADRDLEVGPIDQMNGILFGMTGKKAVSQSPSGSLNKNILVCGLAGSGKSTGFIIPYIYQAVKLGESVIAVDTKGDVYSRTAVYAASHGYEIKVLNCRNPSRSDSWDMLKEVGTDPENVKRIAQTIFDCVKGEDESDEDDFWKNGSLLLLQSLILYVKDEENKRRQALSRFKKKSFSSCDTLGTIGRVMEILSGYDLEEQAADYLQNLFGNLARSEPDNPAVRVYKAFNSATKGDIKNSIIQNLAIKISCFEGQEIQKLLGNDDISLLYPALHKCIYYINLSEQNHTGNFVASIFFRELTNALVNFADAQENKACPIPVTLLLDEFGAIGRIPGFDDFISGSRSRAIRCVVAFQNIDQIRRNYGEGAQTIIANCETWISMGINDLNTARLFSQSIGEATVELETRSYRKDSESQKNEDEYMLGKSSAKRFLLNESEIIRQDKSTALILINRKFPLKLGKIHCWEMREYQSGEHLNMDNYPEDRKKLKRLIKQQTLENSPKNSLESRLFLYK